jgi:hypothetical protein
MSFEHMGFPQLHNSKKCQKNGTPVGGAQGTHRGALCEWGSPSHHIVSKRRVSSIKGLEKKNAFVGFHLRGNGMHFGNGIHHP